MGWPLILLVAIAMADPFCCAAFGRLRSEEKERLSEKRNIEKQNDNSKGPCFLPFLAF
jgi:hypothetical protein